MRNKIAGLCNEKYGSDYSDQNIDDCDGCLTVSGNLFAGCRYCKVRTCVCCEIPRTIRAGSPNLCNTFLNQLLIIFYLKHKFFKNGLE